MPPPHRDRGLQFIYNVSSASQQNVAAAVALLSAAMGQRLGPNGHFFFLFPKTDEAKLSAAPTRGASPNGRLAFHGVAPPASRWPTHPGCCRLSNIGNMRWIWLEEWCTAESASQCCTDTLDAIRGKIRARRAALNPDAGIWDVTLVSFKPSSAIRVKTAPSPPSLPQLLSLGWY